jgi:pantoate--beta-alanine ligase
VACPTLREPDGLSMSSRNVYLSPDERRAALCLSQAVQAAARAVESGERSAASILDTMRTRIGDEPLAKLDYVAVVDEETFHEVEEVTSPARALVAARVGRARLIDNGALPVVEN